MNQDEMLDKLVPEAFLKVLQDQPDAKERRRYQLLQAAAMLASGNAERYLINGGQLVAAFVITDAVDLLAEIERRES